MPISHLQANWSDVEFSSTPITQVTSVKVASGGKVSKFKADASVYNTVAVILTSEPTISITSGDEGVVSGLSGAGVITAQHNDALKVTAGAVLYTVTTGVFEDYEASGDHGEFGQIVANFQTVSSDGVTNPVAITRV